MERYATCAWKYMKKRIVQQSQRGVTIVTKMTRYVICDVLYNDKGKIFEIF